MTEDLVPSPQVSINTETAERIVTLYGIGPELARSIVEYREAHGPFHGPEDLAKVEGISSTLAVTLSPHIDWQVPSPPEESERPDFGFAALSLAVAAGLAYRIGSEAVPRLQAGFLAYRAGDPRAGVSIWMATSAGIAWLSALIACLMVAVGMLSLDHPKVVHLVRVVIYSLIPAALALISEGLAYAVYYQFYAAQGWSELLNPRSAQGLIGGIGALLAMLPVLAVLWRPRLVHNRLFLRVWDVAIASIVLAAALFVWVHRNTFPFWVLAIGGAIGLGYAWLGLAALGSGRHIVQELAADLLSLVDQSPQQNPSALWLAWLNARMPDPIEQRALKDALNKAYPASRSQTLVNVILVGAGGWLLLTVLAAIVDWIVQNWLTGIFGSP